MSKNVLEALITAKPIKKKDKRWPYSMIPYSSINRAAIAGVKNPRWGTLLFFSVALSPSCTTMLLLMPVYNTVRHLAQKRITEKCRKALGQGKHKEDGGE